MAQPLTLNIPKMLRADADPAEGSAELDFSGRDFDGFTVPGPVALGWRASPIGTYVRLAVELDCTIAADCVRCLTPFTEALHVAREMDVAPEDLAGDYTEYPAAPDGSLDLAELAYGEVVLEAPILALCREDCPGLCPRCGAPRAACTCPPEEADTPPPDPRWDKLRALLAEDEEED